MPEPEEAAGRWSDVEAAWRQRDARMDRGASGDWTPVDYAPHLWRQYEMEILSHELRRRDGTDTAAEPNKDAAAVQKDAAPPAGEKPVPPTPTNLANDLRDAQRDFLASQVCADLQRPRDALVRSTLQLRNDCLYLAAYLVAWHADRSQYAGGTDASSEIQRFLAALAEVQRRLDANRLDRLDQQAIDDLRASRQRIGQRLQNDVNAISDSVELDTALARRIQDLLATPLLNAAQRRVLLEKLDQTHAPLDAADAARKCAAPNVARRVLGRMVDPSSDPDDAWQRGLDHARLEAQLVGLVDPEEEARLESTASGPLRPAVRKAEVDLAAFYDQLPQRVAQAARAENGSAELRFAERGMRLLGQQSSGLLDGRSPIPRLSWALPVSVGFEFAGFDEHPVTFDAQSSEEFELSGQLRAVDGFADKVQLELQFDRDQLVVTPLGKQLPDADHVRRDLALDAAHSVRIAYQVRPVNPERPATARLTLLATRESFEPARQTIEFVVPPPERVDLVVMRGGERQNATSPRELSLRTFPGHTTQFQFLAQQRSGKPRTVSVELYGAADAAQLAALGRQQASGRFDPAELTLLAYAESTGKGGDGKEQSLRQMELPADDKPVPIPWSRPATATVAPPAQPPTAQPPEPSRPRPPLAGGELLCVVQDVKQAGLPPMLTWIDVDPWAPKDYLNASAGFDNRKLGIELTQRPGAVLPEDGPVRVVWTNAPADLVASKNALLRAAQPARVLTQPLDISPQSLEHWEAQLDVDAYPRAFVFDIPLDANLRGLEPLKDLRRVTVKPIPDVAIQAAGEADVFKGTSVEGADSIRFQLSIDAPDIYFQPGGTDRVEVGIDENHNEALEELEIGWSASAPRQTTLRLEKLDPDGHVSIRASVSDWEGAFANHWDNLESRLIARLTLGGNAAGDDRVPIIIDGVAPVLTNVKRVGGVYPGAPGRASNHGHRHAQRRAICFSGTRRE